MDPGVLCPNSALEAIAWKPLESVKELKELPELKGWFVREFGSEAFAAAAEAESESPEPPPARKPRSRGQGSKGSGEKSGEKA